MTPACERTTLVEANVDGRLGKTEQASLERHLRTCEECRDHLDELTSLRAAVRELVPPEVSPLAHQRARLALLRKAATPAPRRRRRAWLLALALVCLPAVVFAGRATLQRATESGEPTTPAEAPVMPPPGPVPVVVVAPTPSATPRPPVVVKASAVAPRPTASAPPTRSAASREFADAMDSVARGDFGAGAAKLDRFARAYPQDPRAEEAIYLEAIALERAGRVGEARSVAQHYLATYPHGAHEAQAREILKASP